jgi:hypothetical protein
VSRVIVLGDQADGGNDDASVRRVESYRRLDCRQVVVEAPRVEGKDLEKEFESIASQGLEGHWTIGMKAARRRRDGETDRRGEDATMRNERTDHRKDVNMCSIDCRTGEESSGCSCLERGRRDKAGGSIGREDGLV